MITPVKLSDLVVETDSKKGHEYTKEMLKRYHEADKALEKVCEEKGLEKPVLVC
jgi:hypothetical protein